jgi:hypothetical protein
MNNKNIISNKFDLNWSTMFSYNMLSVIILNCKILSIIILSANPEFIILSVITVSVMLSVMLSVIMPSIVTGSVAVSIVVAP